MPPYGSIDHPREAASRAAFDWLSTIGGSAIMVVGLVSYAALGSHVGVAVGAVEISAA